MVGADPPRGAVRRHGEPVPLTSDYQQGWLFATVPAAEAERPLEVFQGEEHRFPDCITVWKGHEYYNDPGGAKELYLRGVLQGDHAGNLNPDAALTRAEAFALICRLLSLEPGGDPGYADAEPATGIMIPPPPPGPADWRRRTPISTPTGW